MRISDWSSDVCSSDLDARAGVYVLQIVDELGQILDRIDVMVGRRRDQPDARRRMADLGDVLVHLVTGKLAALARLCALRHLDLDIVGVHQIFGGDAETPRRHLLRSEEHTSELQSLMRTSYAVFCLKKKHKTATLQ